MQLWVAVVLFITSVVVAVLFIKLYGKSKKARYVVLTVIVFLLAFALLIYSCLTLILLGGVM